MPTSRQTEFTRKVRTLAGNYQLLKYYPKLLVPFANRMWFHFISYKVARLALPWLLAITFVSSCFLPAPWNLLVVGAQLVSWLLAALDGMLGEGSLFKKLSSPARTFYTMMVAAVMALRIFFVDPRSLWVVTGAKKETSL